MYCENMILEQQMYVCMYVYFNEWMSVRYWFD